MGTIDTAPGVRVVGLRAELRTSALGVGTAAPRLSWRVDTEWVGWAQVAHQVEIDGTELDWVDGSSSVLTPWPDRPLVSRESRTVRIRVRDADGEVSAWSAPLAVEAGLLEPTDWAARWVGPAGGAPEDASAPAPYLRRVFHLAADGGGIDRARLYVTSAGLHRVEINGRRVGNHELAPGWSSYRSRLRYDTHDVTDLLQPGENAIGAVLADGWWRGKLGFLGNRNAYGDQLSLLAQLEVVHADGSVETVTSDGSWRTSTGPILMADLYDGEEYDARLEMAGWSSVGFDDSGWEPVAEHRPDVGELVAPTGPPVRPIEDLPVREVITTPSGATVLDFGQNLVGRVRFTVDGPAGTAVTLRHAEVLEDGELATAPLRSARATDRYVLRGDGPETWEPWFTFHGFRFVEVSGWPGPVDPDAFNAVVLHSDMDRTGSLHCDHELLDRFHENVVWGMRGNFVDVPTDCPQRDERLGWTGDLQVFLPTASFLHDVGGLVTGWLADLAADQRPDGGVPVIVPDPGLELFLPDVAAGWSDAATVVPWDLYRLTGDTGILAAQYDSMRAWVDHVERLVGDRVLWDRPAWQFGDWLDPSAPESSPWEARTDLGLVASAYQARSARILADTATVLGRDGDAATYAELADRVRDRFVDEYVTPSGRMVSDTATAYALALSFDLVTDPARREDLGRNLAEACARSGHTITTGFLGTPEVLPALSATSRTALAYRLLTQTERPSWLYAVTMGATTVWERWDSMLPDGRVNGEMMTSFNHYALGSVASWMHAVIGGLAPDAPGWRRIRVAPVPGPGVTSAACAHRTPYGRTACRWRLDDGRIELAVEVPPNATAVVQPPGTDDEIEVGSGRYEWDYNVAERTVASWMDDGSDGGDGR